MDGQTFAWLGLQATFTEPGYIFSQFSELSGLHIFLIAAPANGTYHGAHSNISLIYFVIINFGRNKIIVSPDFKTHQVNMRIVEHESASAFLDSCHGWLSEREITNHGLLSLADILTPHHPIYNPPFLFNHVTIGGKIAGCCIYAEPDGLVLSECAPEILLVLFDYLQSRIHIPSRIFGPENPSLELAKLFGNLRNAKYRIQSTWRTHRVERLERGAGAVSGHLQIGDVEDGELVREWGKHYNNERPANIDIQEFLSNKLRHNQLYFWIDEEPKCLATISGLNCSGPRISAVYTPPAHRTRGYATALVERISSMFLESGSAYVTLNTLAGDPVERIYDRLGYYIIGEKVSVVFEDL